MPLHALHHRETQDVNGEQLGTIQNRDTQNFLNPNKSKGRESCIHLSCKCCPNLFRHLAQKGYLYCTERYSNYRKFRMF
jgi:hypothetical protein